ncbi:MAG: PAS domain S-box protein, partial [Acidobacteriota bacterium]
HLTSRPLEDSVSEPIGAVLILRDVTERERLLKDLTGYKLAVDSMQIGVTMTDLDRKILYVNNAEAEMHGYEQGELLGRSARSLGTKGEEGSDDRWIERPASWTRRSTNTRADGTIFPVQLFSDVVHDPRGAPVGLVTCCEDLTERVRAEAEIRKLNRAIEQSPALVIITDTEGAIEYVNPQFCQTTGYSAEEAIGQNPRVLRSDETPQVEFEELWSTISKGGTWSGEFHNRKKDGSSYWALASISGLRDDTGVIRHYVGVQVDISRRKELQVQLEAQNAELERLNRLKGDMLAITSHDLKSPLHAMISVANLLRDLGPDLPADSRAGFIDQIISSGQKLSSFISDVLDAEKIESDGLSMVLASARLDKVLEACVATARFGGRENEVDVTLTVDGIPPATLGDAGRLEQIFNNLLSNALKFTPKKSTIEVCLTCEPGYQVVTVGDRGPGIPESDTERIFDRYFQVSSGSQVPERGFGVGLGLFITRQLVENHGGTVTAENREGGGCLFVVRFPVVDPGESTAAETEEGGVKVQEGQT